MDELFYEILTLFGFLAGQEACNLGLAHGTGTLSHLTALGCFFDDAILDRPFRTTLDTVAFEFHGNSS
jgi:hypothetical protein